MAAQSGDYASVEWWDGDHVTRCPSTHPVTSKRSVLCDRVRGHAGEHIYVWDHAPDGSPCEVVVWTDIDREAAWKQLVAYLIEEGGSAPPWGAHGLWVDLYDEVEAEMNR